MQKGAANGVPPSHNPVLVLQLCELDHNRHLTIEPEHHIKHFLWSVVLVCRAAPEAEAELAHGTR